MHSFITSASPYENGNTTHLTSINLKCHSKQRPCYKHAHVSQQSFVVEQFSENFSEYFANWQAYLVCICTCYYWLQQHLVCNYA